MLLLANEHTKTHLNYHLVAAELHYIPKVIDCMHQTIKTYLEMEHSILLSVTRTVYVYQVCHGIGRCVKDGSCSSWSLEWKLMDCIYGISYHLNKCQTLSNTSQMTFFFLSGRQCTGAHALCVQLSPTAAVLSTSFLMNYAPNNPELSALITRFGESDSSASMSRESKRLKKSRRDWLNSGNALISIWVKIAIFVFPRFAR